MSKPKSKVKTRVVTKTSRRISREYDAEGLRELLKKGGVEIPDDAKLFVEVPRGGDWSGMDLVIGEDAPLKIEWTVEHEKVEED